MGVNKASVQRIPHSTKYLICISFVPLRQFAETSSKRGKSFLSSNHDADDDRGLEPEPENSPRIDERRRIARELHDSTSQLLVVLQLKLHQLSLIDHPGAEPLIEECQETIREIREQIRALNVG